MRVRPGRGAARETAATQRTYQGYSFPGPSLGWVSDTNLAFTQPGGAYVLENIFPTATGGRMRRGCALHAELGDPVKSLFTYEYGSTAKLFAATDSEISDVSIATSPVTVYSCTDGNWITAQFESADGSKYIRGVNGVDTPFVFDGSTFSTSPSLSFPSSVSLTPDVLSYTWLYKGRFFFIQKGTLDVWYLPAGQIGGEMTKFPLGGIFSLGGELVFGASWSLETGDGLSAMCIFVTSNGEVAVYAGDNPGDVNDWYKVGIYQIGKPKGPRSFIRRGGDIVVATDIGFIAISQALKQDTVSLSPSAMSAPIEDEWNRFSRERYGDWQAVAWTEGQMVAVALPTGPEQRPTWLVANARTGRWAPYIGWDASCVATFRGGLYFGSPDGNVYEANVGGSDAGKPYVCVWVPCFDQLNVQGVKTAHLVRPVMRAHRKVSVKLSTHADFRLDLPSAPPASPEETASVWGVGKWGEFVWGGGKSEPIIQDSWRSTVGQGEALTVALQVTSNSVVPLDVEFIRTDVLFTSGDMQV